MLRLTSLSRYFLSATALFAFAANAAAQSRSLEAVGTPADQEFDNRTASFQVDLSPYLDVPGIDNEIILINTDLGTIPVEMLPDAAPKTVENFYVYLDEGSYEDGFFHRSEVEFVLQAGGFFFDSDDTFDDIPTHDPIELEYNLANQRGTLAMARLTAEDTATSGWFINTVDNSTILGESNNGGYAVFARIFGKGLDVVDDLADVPTYNLSGFWGSGFATMPLQGTINTISDVKPESFLGIPSITRATLFPDPDSEYSFVTYADLASSDTDVASVSLENNILTVTFVEGATGTSEISLVAQDTNETEIPIEFLVTLVEAFVTPDSLETIVQQAANSFDIVIDSNTVYDASTETEWISLSETDFDGDATLTVTVTANPLQTPRTGTILIDGQTHTVYQEGNFDAWLAAHFTQGEIDAMTPSAQSADSDSDGFSNQVEYLLNLDPANAASTLHVRIEQDSASRTLSATPYSENLTYQLRTSANLDAWTPAAQQTTEISQDQTTITFPLATDTTSFYDLQISSPLLTP